ncbi:MULTISPECIES: B12-binding domain-containing radical SAM protein [Amycolatopsis]|uniref:B12-binding domain-containing radical SAM protein n=1 Tax=Amycolatopsis bullii TaxID=941987 RepID=A0ABQ3KCU3_9PSEU|nr:radical SAM protein [Amycolatopsis bullii]GHG12155.1 B12-binding domain-containing radical SAM protein [Amycolatopsis bullii]
MANVLLVNLGSLPMPGNDPIFPIGLRCIQDALDREGHRTRLVDFVEDPPAREHLSWVKGPWDVIGFTIRNIDPIDLSCDGHVAHYEAFLGEVREVLGSDRPLLVGGGPGYSLFAPQLTSRLGFDVGVVGPGESVMLDIVADPHRYTGSGSTISGGRYPGFVRDTLEHPVRLMRAYAARNGSIGLETKRKTCYQGCVYCPYAYVSGENAGDLKPMESIAAELRKAHENGIRDVFFTDGIFNSELRFAKDVVRTVIGADLPGLTWSAYFTPKPFDDEFADLVSVSNAGPVIVSPDSLDDRVMRLLGKSFDTRHVTRFIERCRRRKMKFKVSVVLGGPGENRESVRNTARYLNEHLESDELTLNVGYRILPETAMARQVGLSPDEILDPTFYPLDPEIFSWIISELDSRFLVTARMLNLIGGRTASRTMHKIPLDQAAFDPAAVAITRRSLPLVETRSGRGSRCV